MTKEAIRVAIVDRTVPHYRAALYGRLMASDSARYHIVAAADAPEAMSCVPYSNGWPWTLSPYHVIPGTKGGSIWQWGAVKAGLSRRFDVILMMANPRDPSLWACAIAAKLTGKRVLMWTHGYRRHGRGPVNRVRRVWHRLADALLFYGHYGKVLSLGAGDPPEKCYVIYNSTDYDRQRVLRDRITPDRRRAIRQSLFGRQPAAVAMAISRFYAGKRVDLLVEAHARLVRAGRDVDLLLVGDGDARPALEAQVERLGTGERVLFYGPCYDEDRTGELIAASDVTVAPAELGLTAMHSLAYGVPVLANDDPLNNRPEFEAIIPGRTGDFFRRDDLDSLTRTIEAWLVPAPRRPHVEAACIEVIERFYNPDAQASVIERAVRGEPPDDLAVARASMARASAARASAARRSSPTRPPAPPRSPT